jgi:hypothetical protein
MGSSIDWRSGYVPDLRFPATESRQEDTKRAQSAQVLELLECAVLLAWSDSGGYRVAGYSVSARMDPL